MVRVLFKKNALRDDIEDASDIPELILCTAHNTIPPYKQLIEHFPIYIAALDELEKSKESFREEVRLLLFLF